MAINPMILASLLQTAPRLLQALRDNANINAGFEEIPAMANTSYIEEALNRGFDAPRIQEDVDSWGLADANKLLGHALHGKNTTEGYFPSDITGSPSLPNLFSNLNMEQQRQFGGPPASLSAGTIIGDQIKKENIWVPKPADPEFEALFNEAPQVLPDPYTTPNPATGMSQEDWDFNEVDQAADNPYAKNALLEKIRKKRGK